MTTPRSVHSIGWAMYIGVERIIVAKVGGQDE
jgi:hypothetical protein